MAIIETFMADIERIVPDRDLRGETVDVSDLVEAFDKVGQLHACTVVQKPNDDRLYLKAGHRRYLAAMQRKQAQLKVAVYDGPEEDVEMAAIYENLARKDLPIKVQSRELARLKEIHASKGNPGGRFTKQAAEATGLGERTVQRRAKLGAEASDELLDAIDNRNVKLHDAEEIAKQPKDKQKEALDRYSTLPPAKRPTLSKEDWGHVLFLIQERIDWAKEDGAAPDEPDWDQLNKRVRLVSGIDDPKV